MILNNSWISYMFVYLNLTQKVGEAPSRKLEYTKQLLSMRTFQDGSDGTSPDEIVIWVVTSFWI